MKILPAILVTSIGSMIRPATTKAFGFGFSDLMTRPMVLVPQELLHRDLTKGMLQNWAPKYEITNDDEKFQVALDLPGLKPDEVKIKVEEGRRMLSIEGVREKSGEGYSFSSQFSQSFSLDPSVEAEQFEAKMHDGVLIVSAPKSHARVAEKSREIPISTDHTSTAASEKGDEE
ncbi:hypothetical protein FisN_13Hu341 [Fistulifera solaris]|uniref:SHSP domain-containing protein n=1 Tax=Fistulifera solaris TaxID=1519565 RepID=A0A1Z5KNB1_FISSO|nr:hypothetical protein FisN_13Hu341 [Fistulifera solaris]|eukprot:GAX27572.1 hypothetical protein FisN_13Hu341 [Fistulifera solaris]